MPTFSPRNRLKLASANRIRGPRRSVTASNLSMGRAKRRQSHARKGKPCRGSNPSHEYPKEPDARLIACVVAAFCVLLCLPAVADIVAVDGWARATVPGSQRWALAMSRCATPARNRATCCALPRPCAMNCHCTSAAWMPMACRTCGRWRSWSSSPVNTLRFEPNGKHVMFMGTGQSAGGGHDRCRALLNSRTRSR